MRGFGPRPRFETEAKGSHKWLKRGPRIKSVLKCFSYFICPCHSHYETRSNIKLFKRVILQVYKVLI